MRNLFAICICILVMVMAVALLQAPREVATRAEHFSSLQKIPPQILSPEALQSYQKQNKDPDNPTVSTLNVQGHTNLKGGRSIHNPNNWNSHFPWHGDQKNYIRGDTVVSGELNMEGPINLGFQNIPHPDKGDGALYRADGQVQIATDDLIRLRHIHSKQTGIQLDARPGVGAIHHPDGVMKISRQGIMFGGPNNGREINSAQISAGQHIPNSLNIVGMSSGGSHTTRRIDMWAEGGLNVYGGGSGVRIHGPLTVCNNGRCDSGGGQPAPAQKPKVCRNASTPWNSEGGGNAIFLDRHNVACQDHESLTRMQLIRNGRGLYQYQYRCCG